MKTSNTTHQKGFTLVEIAIVLVIIGLLLGGVLKGQELIANAKVKNVNNDAQGIIAAMLTYQDRYGVLPGDGNGDGKLKDNDSGSFFKDLRDAGLLKGEGNTFPTHSYGGTIKLDENAYKNAQGNNLCFMGLPREAADILDRQNDNGNPSSGSIQSDNAATTYTVDGKTTYDLCYKL
ncbi:MAG: prepilin-type cleavage/methylation domain-containing protein [Piscirickettsiaceae bacterium CG_4_9_14_3_um_filter_43_564]|nr:MAG: hypothetical protein AUK56_06920 [Thiomicrospira sp. CG2_30_44_34]PIQ05314.1 MAG: prepilin-type cleavage/methylation domain-containing protein [Piscirickettsiaceae bacterium CG18_big_fil_WC_8_21_14_2_50_44_103]PJA65396.1 MAG: prepilin-type cleavage/methylation domain-containing protein [Piscirickettsiaceae bacterium CG_4_9_14_3_um_filter_43_564]